MFIRSKARLWCVCVRDQERREDSRGLLEWRVGCGRRFCGYVRRWIGAAAGERVSPRTEESGEKKLPAPLTTSYKHDVAEGPGQGHTPRWVHFQKAGGRRGRLSA